VTLLGVGPDGRTPGAQAPARMVSRDSGQAYIGETGILVQLRWVLGFALVLLCGLGIAGLTGAWRLETARARRSALLLSLAGPVLLLAGFLLRSQPARLASAAVITLTVGKVFLYDMAGLTGIFRALSFIGLGLVLVGIGYLYQRLLFPRRPQPSVAAAVAPSG
jgi:hypothetical protein